jgi:Fur family transcriptional regulator, iron response regulator
MSATVDLLRRHGIQPSAQRVAIAEFVLATDAHPSADQVLVAVRARLPMVSRATVYNTLHVLVAGGLLRELELAEGRVAYDPKIEPHHHFIDESTGAIRDVPWQALEVRGVADLSDLQVSEYQVVLRGRTRGKS